VLCGPGLLALYRLIAGRPKAGSPLDVTRLAGSGNEDARQALDLLFRFLGTVAGDLALTLGARGGVYLGGGILPILKERLAESGFASRFRDKGRFSDYVRNIPVYLILAETPALRGLMVHPHVQRLMGIQVST
jgi:glucokinase